MGLLYQLCPQRQRTRSCCRSDVSPPSQPYTPCLPFLPSHLFSPNHNQTNSPPSIATTFTACANSLVSDILLPIISLLPFLSRNLSQKFAILKHGPNYDPSISTGYNTREQAVSDGALVFAYGNFLDKIVRFFCVAASLWVIAMTYSRLAGDNIVKKQVRCRYCRKYISEKAKRCVNCTSWLDGREEKLATGEAEH
jgi:large conductance mechanosensitive channel